jgi:hypothetical protein
MLERILAYERAHRVRQAMSDPDYQRHDEYGGVIGDASQMLRDGKELMERAKTMLDRGEKLMAKVENNWLLKLFKLV